MNSPRNFAGCPGRVSAAGVALGLALLAGTLLAGAMGLAAEDAAHPFVIVQPGYAGSTKDAEQFVAQVSEYLEAKTGLKGVAGEYHNEPAAAKKAIETLRPQFGIVSVGYYLEHREELGLKPLLESSPGDRLVIVTRKGDVKDASALKGEPVAGGPLYDLPFLDRIAFRGKAEPLTWDAKPVLYISRALRDLADRNKYRAVVLTGKDYEALAPLYATKSVEKFIESEYYPPAFLVAFHAQPATEKGGTAKAKEKEAKEKEDRENPAPPKLSEETVDKVRRAFSDLAVDSSGKKILETMGAEGFRAIRPDWLKDLEVKYASAEKK